MGLPECERCKQVRIVFFVCKKLFNNKRIRSLKSSEKNTFK